MSAVFAFRNSLLMSLFREGRNSVLSFKLRPPLSAQRSLQAAFAQRKRKILFLQPAQVCFQQTCCGVLSVRLFCISRLKQPVIAKDNASLRPVKTGAGKLHLLSGSLRPLNPCQLKRDCPHFCEPPLFKPENLLYAH